MLRDVRLAWRALAATPSFTIIAVAVLTLGIGASIAIFSVVDAVVLRGLPFDEHDRLAAVLEHDPARPTTFGGGTTTPQTLLDWRAMQQSFEAIGASAGTRFELRNDRGEPDEGRGLRVTHEFFPTLRVRPLHGRLFTPEDEAEGAHHVMVLSHAFWLRRFGGDPGVVGSRFQAGTTSYQIVGILPPAFDYPVGSSRPTEMFVPAMFPQEDRVRGGSRNYNWSVVGRLKPGVSFDQATGQMSAVMAQIDAEHPKWGPGRRARVIPLQERLVGAVRGRMLMLLAAVLLVLLIACANVANLLLARATVRARETGIRAALGAGRWRLVCGTLAESLTLAAAVTAGGLLLAKAGLLVLVAWLPHNLPRVAAIGLDGRVVAIACLAALAIGLLLGLVPAVQTSRPDLVTTLKGSGRSSTTGGRMQALRGALVVAEVALAVVLLVGAGLFIGSFASVMRIDPGFDYKNVLVLDVSPRLDTALAGQAAWEDLRRRGRPYVQEMLAAVSRVPGVVETAGVANGLPLSASWSRSSPTLPGRGRLEGDEWQIDQRTVTPNYLQVMRIPLRRGRHLGTADAEGSEAVALVNDAAAERYWPGEDPLGKRIEINGRERVVVGIFGNIRHLGPEQPVRPEIYLPVTQTDVYGMTLVMRTAGRPLDLVPAVKSAIWAVDPDQRLSAEVVTLEGYMERLIAERRFNMALLSLLGGLGLVIAAAGIFGVMSYLVAQRTNEIGVRMALGATRRNVVSLVLRRAALLVTLGLAVGSLSAWSLAHMVEAFLFQVTPRDPRVFLSVLLTLGAAGLAASAIPARRASSVDPLVALRQE
jgi:putative ABC transport system permease protein